MRAAAAAASASATASAATASSSSAAPAGDAGAAAQVRENASCFIPSSTPEGLREDVVVDVLGARLNEGNVGF